MNTFPATLEFKIHLVNGAVSRFTAEGEASVQRIFEQLQRGKVFTQHSLVLADAKALVVYPSSAIARIDLLIAINAEEFRTLDFVKDGAQKQEITAQQWHEQIESLLHSPLNRSDLLGHPGNSVTTFGQIQLSNGEYIYMEYRYDHNLPSLPEQRRFFQTVFSLPAFPFTSLNGEISILNPSHIISCTFHPGGEPPATAWSVHEIEVNRETERSVI